MFASAFNVTQRLIKELDCVVSGHDVSDGGLVTAVLEMSFAGNVGVDVFMTSQCHELLEVIFTEACGVVMETEDAEFIVRQYKEAGVDAVVIGKTNKNRTVSCLLLKQKLTASISLSK